MTIIPTRKHIIILTESVTTSMITDLKGIHIVLKTVITIMNIRMTINMIIRIMIIRTISITINMIILILQLLN